MAPLAILCIYVLCIIIIYVLYYVFMSFCITLTQFYINFSIQEHQTELILGFSLYPLLFYSPFKIVSLKEFKVVNKVSSFVGSPVAACICNFKKIYQELKNQDGHQNYHY